MVEIIRSRPCASQEELISELRRVGVQATQSSISRDLKELGVVKWGGIYRLPRVSSGGIQILGAEPVGRHLLVLKTMAGQASMVALTIDQANLPGVAGTVAGDDTIFVAVRGSLQQRRTLRQIWELFGQEQMRESERLSSLQGGEN